MIYTNLFTVRESSPSAFVQKKTLCFHYTLTMMLPRDASTSPDRPAGRLFLTTPGFRLPPPVESGEIPEGAVEIEEIVEIVFSDFLVEFFHTPPFSFIGKFLKRSFGYRELSTSVWTRIGDLLLRLRTDTGIEAGLQFLQAISLLAAVEDAIPAEETGDKPAGSPQIAAKIEQIRNYVMENYQKPIKRNEIMKMFGLSSGSFWRFFNQNMGMNFSDYVNTVRVEKASRLLLTTEDTVSGIAYSCGFGTPSYFNEVFRQYKGVTPGRLRIEN